MKKFFKRIFSKSAYEKLVSLYYTLKSHERKLVGWVAIPFSVVRKSSSFFYFISGSLDREAKASLRGRVEFQRRAVNNYPLFRRNIHRLEKGLIMEPRKPVFGSDYIVETVNQYIALSGEIDDRQKKWAIHVLSTYFSCVEVGLSNAVDRARVVFEREDEVGESTVTSIPFCVSEREELNVSYDALMKLVKRRKSVRWFESRAVPLGVIHEVVSVASQAPSACNRQPYQFYFSADKEKVCSVARLAMGGAGFAEEIPSIFCVVGDLSCYDSAHDRHAIYVDSSLAVMQLLLASETKGLATCVLNWPDVSSRDRRLSKLLGLEDYQRVVCLVAIGFPDLTRKTPYSEKKSSQELIKVF